MHENLKKRGTVAGVKLGQEVVSQHDEAVASQAEEKGEGDA